MSDCVEFDPGIGNLVLNLNDFVNNVYSQLMSFKTIHQKRARFKLYYSKIEKYIKNNIDFYTGCLIWAYYLSNTEEKTVINNPFLNLTDEQKEEYDFFMQVNFLENFFDSFERDMLYYTGIKYSIPVEWKNILSLYSEFIQLNDGFVNVNTTKDIKLPEKLKNAHISADINELVQNVIKSEDLGLFSSYYNFN